MKTKLFTLLICLTTGFTMFVTPTRAVSTADTPIPKEDAVALGQALTLLGTTLNQISNRLNTRDGTIIANPSEISLNLTGIRGNLVSINSTLIALSGGGGGQFAQKSLPQGSPAVQPIEKNVAEPFAGNVDLNALLSESTPAPGTVPNNSPIAGQAALASSNFDADKIIWPSVIIILIFTLALWLRKRDKEDARALASSTESVKGVSTALLVEDTIAVRYDSPQVGDDLHGAPVAQVANIGQNNNTVI